MAAKMIIIYIIILALIPGCTLGDNPLAGTWYRTVPGDIKRIIFDTWGNFRLTFLLSDEYYAGTYDYHPDDPRQGQITLTFQSGTVLAGTYRFPRPDIMEILFPYDNDMAGLPVVPVTLFRVLPADKVVGDE